jgi:hypothetical protein
MAILRLHQSSKKPGRVTQLCFLSKYSKSGWRVADVCDDMTRFIIQCELENNWGGAALLAFFEKCACEMPTPCDLRRR